jgi:hypothetical protein
VSLPAALEAVRPGLLDAVVPEPGLHEADQPGHPADHQVVQEPPLVLHLLAQRPGRLDVAAVERLDRAIHRGPRHLCEFVV